LDGIKKMVENYDSLLAESNAKIAELPDTRKLREINAELKQIGIENGWKCWEGTGGTHWSKEGVVEYPKD
jgi:hypothetical protein